MVLLLKRSSASYILRFFRIWSILTSSGHTTSLFFVAHSERSAVWKCNKIHCFVFRDIFHETRSIGKEVTSQDMYRDGERILANSFGTREDNFGWHTHRKFFLSSPATSSLPKDVLLSRVMHTHTCSSSSYDAF